MREQGKNTLPERTGSGIVLPRWFGQEARASIFCKMYANVGLSRVFKNTLLLGNKKRITSLLVAA